MVSGLGLEPSGFEARLVGLSVLVLGCRALGV